jgi:hypothetical protein
MEIHSDILVFFSSVGVLSLSCFCIVIFKYIYNYLNYKDIFYSEKNIRINILKEEIEQLKTKITTLEEENNQITTLIIEKIKDKL